ncbi:MAG: hemerythrin domain-containing protein [Hyphomicrobium sp.]
MAGLTALGRVLHEEHFRHLVWMCDLQNRVTGEAGKQYPNLDNEQDRVEMHDLIAFLDQVMAHHAFEEDVVFPLLRAQSDAELASLLTEEHAAIEPTAHLLRSLALDILRLGPDHGRWPKFRKVAQKLFAEMIDHLEKEELILLQRLDSLLDTETDHQLALQHVSARLLPVVATSPTGLR